MTDKHIQAFLDAYNNFKDMQSRKFSIEIYHNDESSSPFISSIFDVERVILDYVGSDHFVITIHTEDTSYSFNSENWLAHVGSDYVSFGSIHDKITHCIISYC